MKFFRVFLLKFLAEDSKRLSLPVFEIQTIEKTLNIQIYHTWAKICEEKFEYLILIDIVDTHCKAIILVFSEL